MHLKKTKKNLLPFDSSLISLWNNSLRTLCHVKSVHRCSFVSHLADTVPGISFQRPQALKGKKKKIFLRYSVQKKPPKTYQLNISFPPSHSDYWHKSLQVNNSTCVSKSGKSLFEETCVWRLSSRPLWHLLVLPQIKLPLRRLTVLFILFFNV